MSSNIIKISEQNRSPIVSALLEKLEQSDAAIETLLNQNKELKETVQLLKDEIARLKGSTKRPNLRGNKKDKKAKAAVSPNEKRPGSEKVSKRSTLKIHETIVVTPAGLPEGSTLKRRRSFDVQNLIIRPHNTRYVLEEWETPIGEVISAQIPTGIAQGHFGNELCAFILSQHHQCQVTQPLLNEQLRDLGIDISAGQVNNILIEDKEIFHKEKAEMLKTGLSVSPYVQTDDTGARHDGKNGYCTHIGNQFFAWFHSSHSKSRVNFLTILNSAYCGGYILDENAQRYMKREGMPGLQFTMLENSIQKKFESEREWLDWLTKAKIVNKRHVKIATEAALLAGALAGGLNKELVVLSDDAGQFNVPMLFHALCWIHEERHLKNLIPGNNEGKAKDLEKAREDLWTLYRQIEEYRKNPDAVVAKTIEAAFDDLFQRKTSFALLNLAIKRIYAKKSELLLVLKKPAVPLHNNGSETDIREFVKRRKVSGGTRSTSGQKCRDTFASLKKTCRKLGVSFHEFLMDRLAGAGEIESMSALIMKAASNSKLNQLKVEPLVA